MRVKCLAQEHNTMTRPGLEPVTLDPESNALTTRPPHLRQPFGQASVQLRGCSHISCCCFISTGKCFSDPEQCKHHGMTMTASLKLDKKHFHKQSSSYFLSSGGQTTQARGFAFLHLLNRYILILSTKDRQWKLETRDLPEGWFNFAFTWEKNGLIKLYVNGMEVSSGEAMGVSRPKDNFSTLQVGRPNNSHSPKFRVPLEIDNIALWEKALTSKEIGALAQKGETMFFKNAKPGA